MADEVVIAIRKQPGSDTLQAFPPVRPIRVPARNIGRFGQSRASVAFAPHQCYRHRVIHGPDIDPDEVWRSVVAVGAAAELSEVDLHSQFEHRFGFSPDEASAGELLVFRAELQEPRPAPDPRPHEFRIGTERGGDWISVQGGGLPQPIEVRIAVIGDRPRIVGIHIDNGQEVSADVLRGLRLGQVLKHFLEGYSPQGPDVRGMAHSDQHAVLHDLDAWVEWGLMHEFLNERVARADAPVRAKKGTAPSEAALRNFARIYVRHFKTQQHGALAATAREIPVARSTAYRWLSMCRERGYLHTEERT